MEIAIIECKKRSYIKMNLSLASLNFRLIAYSNSLADCMITTNVGHRLHSLNH